VDDGDAYWLAMAAALEATGRGEGAGDPAAFALIEEHFRIAPALGDVDRHAAV
jgi:hypothetical protein